MNSWIFNFMEIYFSLSPKVTRSSIKQGSFYVLELGKEIIESLDYETP